MAAGIGLALHGMTGVLRGRETVTGVPRQQTEQFGAAHEER